METTSLKVKFNNKGLKKLHPKSLISKKKIEIKDQPNMKFVQGLVRESDLKNDYSGFTVKDLKLEGTQDNWVLEIIMDVWA